ncbi:hypothetical protein C3E99_06110 [Sphingopyxis sp. MG]|nr:hypothetical protein C3E99_06110 [Sphingopyxis sp. MG]
MVEQMIFAQRRRDRRGFWFTRRRGGAEIMVWADRPFLLPRIAVPDRLQKKAASRQAPSLRASA